MTFMKYIYLLLFLCLAQLANAQQGGNKNEVYIDAKGTLRLSKTGGAASFFGVNYTLPFAYGYRSHRKLNINLEKAIDQDVYHLARLGVNAFRVHVWDTEISDSLGNLKQNEHLRLLDYLLFKLEARNIRIILTPIAFWGNGYPDPDEKTGSFVEKYGKNGSVITPAAFLAQENYLKQFFKHVNPYTQKTYTDDRFVIATEVNNEPHHTGAKALATTYINRMIKAIKGSGWTKPVFYNISESPTYADAVAKSNADGFSFQWYPTGLVAGHAQKGNLLPNVDHYVIPFDTIPEFKNKPRMIYEFESADVMQPYMYPAMARSFKTAGFQWATQFAYDPLGTAYANTEYQTHYLNLAYTPSKAISLLIAAQVFKLVPLNKEYGSLPADTAFGAFTLSYKGQSSQFNVDSAFYYANGSTTKLANTAGLKHVAGVGSSTIVRYAGSGAYFLDKLGNGSWRLEVMPDAVFVRDPFAKNDLNQVVTKIVHGKHQMQVNLKDLGLKFSIKPLDQGNTFSSQATDAGFEIQPGTYLLQNPVGAKARLPKSVGVIGLTEFVAPPDTKMPSGQEQIAQVMRSSTSGQLDLFSGVEDLLNLQVYAPEWKTDPYYFKKDSAGVGFLSLQHIASASSELGGLQVNVSDKLKGNASSELNAVAVKVKASQDIQAKITLIDQDAKAFTADILVKKGLNDLRLPLSAFKASGFLLLPRPYPGFQKLEFRNTGTKTLLNLEELERVQFLPQGDASNAYTIDIYNIIVTKAR
jgi:hypothetical protein